VPAAAAGRTVGAGDGRVDGVGHQDSPLVVAEEWRKAPPEPFRVRL
jgi:hypothetical protein